MLFQATKRTHLMFINGELLIKQAEIVGLIIIASHTLLRRLCLGHL